MAFQHFPVTRYSPAAIAGRFGTPGDVTRSGIQELEVALIVTEELELRARDRSELRNLLTMCGFRPPNGLALNAVLSRCKDVDLAFTALTMTPRPKWVRDLVGCSA